MSEPINNRLILSIIERGIDTLGEDPKKTLWLCLENDYNYTQENIPENLEAFQHVLQEIFGAGYSSLDNLFRLQLQETTSEDLRGYASFVECVKALRNKKPLSSPQSEAIRR
jgi:hypothetical protein